jgi:hypothetical protein
LGYEETFHEYMDDGTRNLDSQMVDTAADLMFPKDKRFYSFITTITMHGMYYDRENLQAEHNPHIAKGLEILQQYFPDEDEEDYEDDAVAAYVKSDKGLDLEKDVVLKESLNIVADIVRLTNGEEIAQPAPQRRLPGWLRMLGNE